MQISLRRMIKIVLIGISKDEILEVKGDVLRFKNRI